MDGLAITQLVLFANGSDSTDLTDAVHTTGQHAQPLNQMFSTRAIGKEQTEEGLSVRCSICGTWSSMRCRSIINEHVDWPSQQPADHTMLAHMLPSGSKILRIAHVAFDRPPKPCFNAPVTEITIATAKDEQDLLTFGGMCDLALRTTIDQLGCKGTAWGCAQEDPRVFVLLAGWDAIKVCLKMF